MAAVTVRRRRVRSSRTTDEDWSFGNGRAPIPDGGIGPLNGACLDDHDKIDPAFSRAQWLGQTAARYAPRQNLKTLEPQDEGLFHVRITYSAPDFRLSPLGTRGWTSLICMPSPSRGDAGENQF